MLLQRAGWTPQQERDLVHVWDVDVVVVVLLLQLGPDEVNDGADVIQRVNGARAVARGLEFLLNVLENVRTAVLLVWLPFLGRL